jgi:repressor LexA
VGLPILGSIAAGSPIEAIEDSETLQVEDVFPQTGDHYLLRVRGHSMIDDHIDDGDLVIVERTTTARNGDTVVAILPGDGIEEATLKRYYRESDCVRLEPRNPTLEPIRVTEVEIRGIVRGVLRQY